MTAKENFVTCEDNELITALVEKIENFDLLPVSSKEIQYFVSKETVKKFCEENRSARVREFKQPIFEYYRISADEPIHNYLMQWKKPVFVIEHDKVVGIVDRADLNKIPSKMLFYLLISSFERLLIKTIKNLDLTSREIEGYIGFSKLWNALGINELARRENFHLSLIDCLTTSDLINISCKSKRIQKLLKYQTEQEARKNLKPIVHLRNKVMHTGRFIVQNEKQLIKRRSEYNRIRQHIIDLT